MASQARLGRAGYRQMVSALRAGPADARTPVGYTLGDKYLASRSDKYGYANYEVEW